MILGLCGYKGAGKDTAGEYLVQRFGFTRLSFAEPMKRSAAGCFRANPADWEWLKNDPDAYVTISSGPAAIYRVTVREFLQNYGTEAHRDIPEFGEAVWTNMLLEKVPGAAGHVVVTDSRFDNECQALQSVGGYVVLIDRGEGEGDTHASEKLPEKIDFTIPNHEAVELMHLHLDALVRSISGAAAETAGAGGTPV